MIDILGSLSASAAAGMRIALPILLIGLLQNYKLWSDIPVLSHIHPQVLLGILTSWSLFELVGSKKLLGQRLLQIIQLVFSPIAGGLMAMTVAHLKGFSLWLTIITGIIGGTLALVLKLVEVGWFFRWRGLPLWLVSLEDLLSFILVCFAFKAPEQGGLIAMLLLWLALRSSNHWLTWYKQTKQ